jgi:periplasmic divalent cation tolerance protein
MPFEPITVYTTLPDETTAKEVARTLVTERLAACANFFPIHATYLWQGELEQTQEWAMVLKTDNGIYPNLEARLKELHPYGVPAIVSYKIANGLPAYLSWINDSTGEIG